MRRIAPANLVGEVSAIVGGLGHYTVRAGLKSITVLIFMCCDDDDLIADLHLPCCALAHVQTLQRPL